MEDSNLLEKLLTSCTDDYKVKKEVIEYLFKNKYRVVIQKKLIELQDLNKVNIFSDLEFYNIFVQLLNNGHSAIDDDNSAIIENNQYLSLDDIGKNTLQNILSAYIDSEDNKFVMIFSNIFREILVREVDNGLSFKLSPQLRISDFYKMDQDYLKSSLSFFNELAQFKNITVVISGAYTKTIYFDDFDGLLSQTIEEATEFIENYSQASKSFENISFEVFDTFLKFWKKYISFLERNPIDGEVENPYQAKYALDYLNLEREFSDYFCN